MNRIELIKISRDEYLIIHLQFWEIFHAMSKKYRLFYRNQKLNENNLTFKT